MDTPRRHFNGAYCLNLRLRRAPNDRVWYNQDAPGLTLGYRLPAFRLAITVVE